MLSSSAPPHTCGTASAAFHAFAEAGSRWWFSQAWVDKLAAGFTNSGAKNGDTSSTLGYFATMAAQHGVHGISLGPQPGWDSTTGSEDGTNRLRFFSWAPAPRARPPPARRRSTSRT